MTPSDPPRARGPQPVEIGTVEPSDVARPNVARHESSVRSTLELTGLVIAPTALLTALAFYFGWTLTNARSRYFGIDASALDFSTRDYVLRSTDAVYVPLSAVLAVALTALAVHTLASPHLREPTRPALLLAPWVIVALGFVLLVLGGAAVFTPLPFDVYYLIPPLAPGLGAVLLGYGLYLTRGRLAPLAIALLVSLVVLSAFWGAAKYADALGRGRAKQLERSLASQPSVVVYAKHPLGLRPPVLVTRLDGAISEYPFRYEGLRLLVRSAGKYFLVPDTWRHDPRAQESSGDTVAIVLPDTNEFRFEFGPGNR